MTFDVPVIYEIEMPPIPSVEMPNPALDLSFSAPATLTASPTQERASDDINVRGKIEWEKHMKDVDLQRRYRKVSVIMIHWEKDGEDSVNAQEEVRQDHQLDSVSLTPHRLTP